MRGVDGIRGLIEKNMDIEDMVGCDTPYFEIADLEADSVHSYKQSNRFPFTNIPLPFVTDMGFNIFRRNGRVEVELRSNYMFDLNRLEAKFRELVESYRNICW